MKELWNKMKRPQSICAGFFVLFGLVLLIWPEHSLKAVCYGTGAALAAYGILQIIQYLRSPIRTVFLHGLFLIGVIMMVVGFWLIWKPKVVVSILPFILGVVLFFHGLQDVAEAWRLRKQEYLRWWLALLFGAATIALGVFLIAHPFSAVEMLFRCIGVFLICDGGTDLWIQSRITEL